ncbi:hypothetical protein [Arsenophonus endosymbiont of Bemisia tabaci]|uniref:hypothetical protein n=1 Tax=Arsenophonus endosymbiont of Bemisia tabaci TaxID=536059 RepID=UPI0015F4586F|nr:hypothetical protein [Arsenophonus endosymbiont of Bemisia tabaci]
MQKKALKCDTDILFALNMSVIKIKSLSYTYQLNCILFCIFKLAINYTLPHLIR